MSSRDFQQINILIPGYSIEDLPSDLTEKSASSLLNAFAIAWHPLLLNRSVCIPEFKQAESTELPTGQHIVIVPECSEDWLGHDWKENLADTLSVVISGCIERTDYLDAVAKLFIGDDEADAQPVIDGDLLQDFLALGTCHLQVMLLSRRMHHFVDPDNYLLENEAMAAAETAVKGEIETAKDHLRRCFECLQDCREQFYPVESYFVDLCLPSDQTTTEELQTLISENSAISLVCKGSELKAFCEADSNFAVQLSAGINDGRVSLLTGHDNELRISLGTLSALYSDLAASQQWLNSLTKDTAVHWARRRFGMCSGLPAVLKLFDFSSALHVVLDDGLYPDREHGQLQWQGPDGSEIPAISRIPLAIDGSSSFLRFADRMTESMQEDTNAVMLLARLPQLHTPWLNDLKRAAEYGPVLAQFVTMTDFIDHTANQGSGIAFDEGEYLSPYLIQSSVLKTEAPISSPADLHQQRCRLESVAAVGTLCAIMKPGQPVPVDIAAIEQQLNAEESRRIELDTTTDSSEDQQTRLSTIAATIDAAGQSSVEYCASLLPTTDANRAGRLLVNSLPWSRSVAIEWPKGLKPPAASETIRTAYKQKDSLWLNCEVPAGGFAWLGESSGKDAAAVQKAKGKPLAESTLLRNQLFEVELSEITGGISSVRFHNQRANRVSQQIAFRYDFSKTVTIDDEEIVTAYAATRALSSQVLESGPFRGSVETTCEIVDVVTEAIKCRFRQTTSVERDSSLLHIRIDIDEFEESPTGNPWMTYLAARFAWDNESAAITRSMLGQARGFRMERFEALDYIEVADADQRLLIVPHGRPYHRRTGRRMLDSLLAVEGETARSFEFTLDFDQAFPIRTAMQVAQPVLQSPTAGLQPTKAASAWILGLSAKNVVIARSRNEASVSEGENRSVVLLLEETEGRKAGCKIHTARPIQAARLRLATGTTVQDLPVTDGSVTVEFSRFQIKEVELTF